MSYSNFNRGRGQTRQVGCDGCCECVTHSDCVENYPMGEDRPEGTTLSTCKSGCCVWSRPTLDQSKRSTWTAGASQSQPYIMSAPAGGGTIGPAAASIGFSGDMYPSSCGTQSATTSVGEYVVGMATVGMLFFIIGYSLRKGGDLA